MGSREKLIELLENASYQFDNRDCGEDAEGCEYHCYPNCWAQFIADHLIANGVTIQRWIPVEERMPEDDGEYLALGNYFGWWHAVLMFAKDGRKVDKYDFHERWENVWYDFDRDYGHSIYGSVTHWMPLPEPPKEE